MKDSNFFVREVGRGRGVLKRSLEIAAEMEMGQWSWVMGQMGHHFGRVTWVMGLASDPLTHGDEISAQ